MGKKPLWFLLAASVAVNLFFLAGLLYPQLMGAPEPSDAAVADPVAAAAEDLDLSAAQVAGLEALRQRTAERREAAGGNGGSFRALLLTELAKPVFDRDGLLQQMEERRARMGTVVLDTTEDLHGYLATLSPEQKAAFLERAQDRGFLRRLLWPQREQR
ncbi:periplasmic heavy metal sensor [Pelagibius sp.]|uniref:periplasmic heavy metal sensor n=1 Tax=Pelagibius sp. TaxID=1931238 RepID=UPI002621524B|nr:periplasmic heavy metal sensor [Pelagibius sp.]